MLFDDIFQILIKYFTQDNFAQIYWFLGMITIITAYMQKDDNNVKKLMLLSAFFWGTHFYFLWVYSGLAATVISVMRVILSIKFQKNIKAFMLIIGITMITWVFTFDGLYSLIPILTSMSGAYSYFFLEKIKLRLMMMLNSSLWLVYNIFIWSISGITNEIFIQVILIMTVYRMIHPEWGTRYYANKIKDILWKRSRPDYDRFIFIHDRVIHYRQIIWTHFLKILHYDLREFLPKKKSLFSKLRFHKKKEMSAVELIH